MNLNRLLAIIISFIFLQNASLMYPTAPSALIVFDVENAGMTCMPFLTNPAWFAFETAPEALSPQTLATLENTAGKQ